MYSCLTMFYFLRSELKACSTRRLLKFKIFGSAQYPSPNFVSDT